MGGAGGILGSFGGGIAQAGGILGRTTAGVGPGSHVLTGGGLMAGRAAGGSNDSRGPVFVSNARRHYRIVRTDKVPSYSIVILAEFQIVMTTIGFHLPLGTAGRGP